VELNKKKDRGLGLSIVGKKSGPGVFISEVVKGGAADIDGRLVQGDQVRLDTNIFIALTTLRRMAITDVITAPQILANNYKTIFLLLLRARCYKQFYDRNLQKFVIS